MLVLLPPNVVEGGSGAIERLAIVLGDNSDDTDDPRPTALWLVRFVVHVEGGMLVVVVVVVDDDDGTTADGAGTCSELS